MENSRQWNIFLAQKMLYRYKADRRMERRFLKLQEVTGNTKEDEFIITESFDTTILKSEPRDPTVNEMYLFHGTRSANVEGIIREGFNLSKARPGLYGKAVYLAESAEKADQYTG